MFYVNANFIDIGLHIFVYGVLLVAPLVSFVVFTILDMHRSK